MTPNEIKMKAYQLFNTTKGMMFNVIVRCPDVDYVALENNKRRCAAAGKWLKENGFEIDAKHFFGAKKSHSADENSMAWEELEKIVLA